MIARFHPTLPWRARLELAARLGWVWARVPRLPAPAGPAGVVGGRQPALTILGIGDSIMAGIGVVAQTQSLVAQVAAQLARDGREVRWRNAGVSGATAAMLGELLEVIVPRAPDLLLLSCGVNDAVRGYPAEDFRAHLNAFYRKSLARWPAASVVHAGIPPLESFPALAGSLGRVLGTHSVSCVAAARGAAIEAGARYVDFPQGIEGGHFARDGFHPNAAGCAAWANSIARALIDGGAFRAADASAARL